MSSQAINMSATPAALSDSASLQPQLLRTRTLYSFSIIPWVPDLKLLYLLAPSDPPLAFRLHRVCLRYLLLDILRTYSPKLVLDVPSHSAHSTSRYLIRSRAVAAHTGFLACSNHQEPPGRSYHACTLPSLKYALARNKLDCNDLPYESSTGRKKSNAVWELYWGRCVL